MNLTDRDKKLVKFIAPVALVLIVWFLVLAPKRHEAASLGEKLAQAEQKRDDAKTNADSLESSKQSYVGDYETVVRLGKAIPATLDMPSLLVQLDRAARGTKIDFTSVKAGQRTDAPAPASTTSSSSGASPAPTPSSSSGSGSPPAAAAGGPQAQTGVGKAAEKANGAAGTSDQANAKAGATSTSTSTSPTTGSGSSASTSGVAGLDSVPLDFEFSGSFFDLADFFHRMKRFVRLTNDQIRVQGRLMTIDTVGFDSTTFPNIKAKLSTTVYLSPKGQGVDAGATPAGPQATPASSSSAAPTTPPAGQGAPASNGGNTQ